MGLLGLFFCWFSVGVVHADFKKVKYSNPDTGQTLDVAEGELLIQFKSNKTSSGLRRQKMDPAGVYEVNSIEFDSAEDKIVRVIKIRNAQQMENVIRKLQANPDVEYVEPNYIRKHFFAPSYPLYTTGASEEYAGATKFLQQWSPSKTALPQAWDITTGNSTVLIGICDDGIDSSHEDLTGKIVKQYDFGNVDSNASHVSVDRMG